jgi:hypothetical protein
MKYQNANIALQGIVSADTPPELWRYERKDNMKYYIYLLSILILVAGYSNGFSAEPTVRKDVEQLNRMYTEIKAECRIKEINDTEVVGLTPVPKGARPTMGMVIYNGRIAGLLGPNREVFTYQGKTDNKTYKKNAKFIKYYSCDK